jgi:hypothetical protein
LQFEDGFFIYVILKNYYAGSIIIQAIVDVSVPLLDVIVKSVPAFLAVILKNPGVPPSTCDVTKIILLAVTLFVLTVTVPATNVATPAVGFVAAGVDVAVLTANPSAMAKLAREDVIFHPPNIEE